MKVRVTSSDSNDIYLHYNEGSAKLTVRMSEEEAEELLKDLLRALNDSANRSVISLVGRRS